MAHLTISMKHYSLNMKWQEGTTAAINMNKNTKNRNTTHTNQPHLRKFICEVFLYINTSHH